MILKIAYLIGNTPETYRQHGVLSLISNQAKDETITKSTTPFSVSLAGKLFCSKKGRDCDVGKQQRGV